MKLTAIDRTHLLFEDAKLIFCNFAGNPGKMNEKGKRNFKVIIDNPEAAQMLMDNKVRVKLMKKDREDDPDWWTCKVIVNFDGDYPPRIKTVTSKKIEKLGKETVGDLDKRGAVHHTKFEVNLSRYDDTQLGCTMNCMYLVSMKAYLNESWFDDDDDDEVYQAPIPELEPAVSGAWPEDDDIPF